VAERPCFQDVRVLAELEHISDVNRYLEAGWIPVRPPAEDEIYYVVGWTKDEEPRRPKCTALAELHEELAAEIAKTVGKPQGA
jgi:hypothetical protein